MQEKRTIGLKQMIKEIDEGILYVMHNKKKLKWAWWNDY